MAGPRPTRRRAVSVWLAATLALGACGAARTVSTARLADDIADVVLTDYDVSAINVACPNGIKANEGTSFICTVTLPDDGMVDFEVTQLDSDGRLSFGAVQAVIHPATPAAAIADEFISNRGVNVDVICRGPNLEPNDDPKGERFIIAEVGDTFRCRAETRGGKVTPARVTVEGVDGSFSFELLR